MWMRVKSGVEEVLAGKSMGKDEAGKWITEPDGLPLLPLQSFGLLCKTMLAHVFGRHVHVFRKKCNI